MSIQIIRNDITRVDTDAIVNPTDSYFTGRGGTDGAIHRAAGNELRSVCDLLEGLKPGEACITPGFKLKAKYVIHTVGPIWAGGTEGESEKLRLCYLNSLQLAAKHGLNSIAFPLLASGRFRYPKAEAVSTAVNTIREFLRDHDMVVYLVVYDKEALRVSEEQYGEVRSFITQSSIDRMKAERRSGHVTGSRPERNRPKFATERRRERPAEDDELIGAIPDLTIEESPCVSESAIPEMPLSADADGGIGSTGGLWGEEEFTKGTSLEQLLSKKDKGFAATLLDMIDARGISDADCYKAANVDKTLFNKIKNKKGYKPQKSTVVALAFALKPTRGELDDLLARAGYALSNSSDFDIIINYCFGKGIFDVMEVNCMLFQFDQPLLGSISK